MKKEKAKMRQFGTGATRNIDTNKLDYEGFLSPIVLERYAKYLHKHRKQKDGTYRDSDNWQKGIPLNVYMKSMLRHVQDVWTMHRGFVAIDPDTGDECDIEDILSAVMFNAMGYLFELLKEKCRKKECVNCICIKEAKYDKKKKKVKWSKTKWTKKT